LASRLGFVQSEADPCVYYRGSPIFLLYTDDSILLSPSDTEINKAIGEISGLFNITDQGQIDDYLGVKVQRRDGGSIKLWQPHLIDSILKDLKSRDKVKAKPTPAVAMVILDKDEDGEDFDDAFHYRAVIGKLNFLEKSTCPDIAYAVHQVARFSADPKASHGKAVRTLCHYLTGTKDRGLVYIPDLSRKFEVWVDSDFLGLWKKEMAIHLPSTARSRSRFIIMYAGCPVAWISRLQTEVAHSSTEAEYVALSQALRDTIPLMRLLEEAMTKGVPISTSTPIF
jgi:hypothetical protein